MTVRQALERISAIGIQFSMALDCILEVSDPRGAITVDVGYVSVLTAVKLGRGLITHSKPGGIRRALQSIIHLLLATGQPGSQKA